MINFDIQIGCLPVVFLRCRLNKDWRNTGEIEVILCSLRLITPKKNAQQNL